MDLNDLPAPPAPTRLRAVRMKSAAVTELLELPDPTEFDAQEPMGEALSDEERAEVTATLDAGLEDHHGYAPYDPTSSIAMNIAAAAGGLHPGLVDKGEPNSSRHLCFVTPCRWYLDVPPIAPDLSSLMGGASVAVLEQAREVEQLLEEHLGTHSLIEWATALRKAQGEATEALKARFTAEPRIASGYLPDGLAAPTSMPGVTAGPTKRSPEKQAAVDAMDARLGRGKPITDAGTPEEREAYDNQLRAARDARRARQPSPYDLTPKWSQDIGDGVVGIKR